MKFHTALLLAALLVCTARAPAAEMESFNSAGVKIVYLQAGRGAPVILVHGLYSSARMNWVFPGIFAKLAANYHVIAFDLRGHGDSDKPADDIAYGQPMADDLLRLMDHLHIQKANLVGYSLGGIVVMKFLVDHPQRCASAALGGMGWLREGSFEQAMFQNLGEAGQTPAACVHGIARLALTEPQVRQIKTPLEILVGDNDPCRALYVRPLQRVRPDLPVVIINDAGHITCLVKPQFQDGLAKWLAANAK